MGDGDRQGSFTYLIVNLKEHGQHHTFKQDPDKLR